MESTVWEGMYGQEALKQIRRGSSTEKKMPYMRVSSYVLFGSK